MLQVDMLYIVFEEIAMRVFQSPNLHTNACFFSGSLSCDSPIPRPILKHTLGEHLVWNSRVMVQKTIAPRGRRMVDGLG